MSLYNDAPEPIPDAVGPYVHVRATRIELTDADDMERVFTDWFMDMWDAENRVWRQGKFPPPISRAQYEAKLALALAGPPTGRLETLNSMHLALSSLCIALAVLILVLLMRLT